MSAPRIELAESFLQEAVFRSREKQAAGMELRRSARTSAGSCGLGERALLELELSTRGKDLFSRLWPAGQDEAGMVKVNELLSDWVARQDALDRKRNHFIKDFRLQHGFDRTNYNGVLSRQFAEGLAEINSEETEKRRETASRLLAG